MEKEKPIKIHPSIIHRNKEGVVKNKTEFYFHNERLISQEEVKKEELNHIFGISYSQDSWCKTGRILIRKDLSKRVKEYIKFRELDNLNQGRYNIKSAIKNPLGFLSAIWVLVKDKERRRLEIKVLKRNLKWKTR